LDGHRQPHHGRYSHTATLLPQRQGARRMRLFLRVGTLRSGERDLDGHRRLATVRVLIRLRCCQRQVLARRCSRDGIFSAGNSTIRRAALGRHGSSPPTRSYHTATLLPEARCSSQAESTRVPPSRGAELYDVGSDSAAIGSLRSRLHLETHISPPPPRVTGSRFQGVLTSFRREHPGFIEHYRLCSAQHRQHQVVFLGRSGPWLVGPSFRSLRCETSLSARRW